VSTRGQKPHGESLTELTSSSTATSATSRSGRTTTELPVGSRIVVDMSSLALGWTCWAESQVVEEILVPVVDGKPPLEHELTDHGPYDDDDDGWRESASISAVISSYGTDEQRRGSRHQAAVQDLDGRRGSLAQEALGAYGRVFMQHPGEFPVVELLVDSYIPKNKKHGKKYALTFKIVAWVTEAEMDRSPTPTPTTSATTSRNPLRASLHSGRSRLRPPTARSLLPPVAAPRNPKKRKSLLRLRAVVPLPSRSRKRKRSSGSPSPRAPEPEEEEEVAPAPRRRSAPEPEEEEEVAPAPRRRSAPEPEEEEEVAPAPRRRAAAPAADEDEELAAPAPRGRSAGRGAPPASARLRRFD
jgi:hypothetical protein